MKNVIYLILYRTTVSGATCSCKVLCCTLWCSVHKYQVSITVLFSAFILGDSLFFIILFSCSETLCCCCEYFIIIESIFRFGVKDDWSFMIDLDTLDSIYCCSITGMSGFWNSDNKYFVFEIFLICLYLVTFIYTVYI